MYTYVILVGHRHSDKCLKARMSMRLTCALAATSWSITRPAERSLAVLLLHRMSLLQAQYVWLTYMYFVCQSSRRSLADLHVFRMSVLLAQYVWLTYTCISYVTPLGAVLLTYMYSVCQSCRRRSNIWTRALY